MYHGDLGPSVIGMEAQIYKDNEIINVMKINVVIHIYRNVVEGNCID
jgi:hypothetical protein